MEKVGLKSELALIIRDLHQKYCFHPSKTNIETLTPNFVFLTRSSPRTSDKFRRRSFQFQNFWSNPLQIKNSKTINDIDIKRGPLFELETMKRKQDNIKKVWRWRVYRNYDVIVIVVQIPDSRSIIFRFLAILTLNRITNFLTQPSYYSLKRVLFCLKISKTWFPWLLVNFK